jgi:hypothetical protein
LYRGAQGEASEADHPNANSTEAARLEMQFCLSVEEIESLRKSREKL